METRREPVAQVITRCIAVARIAFRSGCTRCTAIYEELNSLAALSPFAGAAHSAFLSRNLYVLAT